MVCKCEQLTPTTTARHSSYSRHSLTPMPCALGSVSTRDATRGGRRGVYKTNKSPLFLSTDSRPAEIQIQTHLPATGCSLLGCAVCVRREAPRVWDKPLNSDPFC